MHSKQASLAEKILQLFVHTLGVDGGVIAQKTNPAPILVASLETPSDQTEIFLNNSHLLQRYTDFSQSLEQAIETSAQFKERAHGSVMAFSWTAPNDQEMLVFLHRNNKAFTNSDKGNLQTIIDF